MTIKVIKEKPFYVLVTGGRDFSDLQLLNRAMHLTLQCMPVGRRMCIVHGCASGADKLADHWAKSWKAPVFRVPAEWGRFDKGAGHIRNQQMLDWLPIDRVLAFPGGKGTADMVARAHKANIQVTHALELLGVER